MTMQSLLESFGLSSVLPIFLQEELHTVEVN